MKRQRQTLSTLYFIYRKTNFFTRMKIDVPPISELISGYTQPRLIEETRQIRPACHVTSWHAFKRLNQTALLQAFTIIDFPISANDRRLFWQAHTIVANDLQPPNILLLTRELCRRQVMGRPLGNPSVITTTRIVHHYPTNWILSSETTTYWRKWGSHG